MRSVYVKTELSKPPKDLIRSVSYPSNLDQAMTITNTQYINNTIILIIIYITVDTIQNITVCHVYWTLVH